MAGPMYFGVPNLAITGPVTLPELPSIDWNDILFHYDPSEHVPAFLQPTRDAIGNVEGGINSVTSAVGEVVDAASATTRAASTVNLGTVALWAGLGIFGLIAVRKAL